MTLQQNNILEKFKKHLRQNQLVLPGMHVCVCYSGGVDSSVLLHLLYELRGELNITLSACHFNHMIRGDEADRDELFCAEVCSSLGIPFYTGRGDVPFVKEHQKLSMEEAARNARYAWFEALANEHPIDLFATAHHKNDQAETVLFRMIRGTTVAGLAGIHLMRDRYIRPLLCLTKSEIESYARGNNICYRTDSSNFSQKYTRNFIRHTVMPVLENINPAAVDALQRLSVYSSEDESLVSSLLPQYEPKQNVSGLHPAIVRRTVARNYSLFCNQTLCYTHIDLICQALNSGKSIRIGLPDDHFVQICNGTFYFQNNTFYENYVIETGILTEGVTYCCDGKVRLVFCANDPDSLDRFENECNQNTEFVYNLSTEIPLSFRENCGIIQYRSRRQGDRLMLHGVHRSVKKLISENKIPVHLREMIPVVCDEQQPICIPFVAVSDHVYCKRDLAQFILRVDIHDIHARKVVEEI